MLRREPFLLIYVMYDAISLSSCGAGSGLVATNTAGRVNHELVLAGAYAGSVWATNRAERVVVGSEGSM